MAKTDTAPDAAKTDTAPDAAKTDTAPDTAPDAVTTAEAPTQRNVRVRAVHGDLIHPFTTFRFTTDSEDKTVEDTWVKIQIEAGKLAVVTD